MIKEFSGLTKEETELLFKAPVIFSVHTLAAFKNINKTQKEDAVKLAHIKTYIEHYLLMPYYEEVDKNFRITFETYLDQVSPFDSIHLSTVNKDMEKIYSIIDKLDPLFGGLLRKSLEGYARHVKNAAHSVFQDIIFPVTFSRL